MSKILASLAVITLLAVACKPKSEATQERPLMEKTDNSGPEFTSRFFCPMNCKGSGSDTMGVCPVCGMDYELNPNFKVQ